MGIATGRLQTFVEWEKVNCRVFILAKQEQSKSMRVKRIIIEKWRHFENIEIAIPLDTKLICLIGTNGGGKSQILELIAACAQRIGISHGFDAARGHPFNEESRFLVEFQIDTEKLEDLSTQHLHPFSETGEFQDWDGTLIASRSIFGNHVIAGNCGDLEACIRAGEVIKNAIHDSKAVHYLMLDADRAYPKIQVNVNELGGALETQWESTGKARAHSGTKTLYQEWFKYLLGIESQENNNHIAAIRKARESGAADPIFEDKLEPYKTSLQKVLPHLLFTGIDTKSRQVKFNSTGTDLEFAQLSGGEREIAFLVGQIERFGLKHGLLLVDEPELHLNNELVRTWIRFLQESVESGQVWLASHSLEVVEVAGRTSTFLLERDDDRKVRTCSRLDDRPVVSTLSRSIGSPAFSITGYTFLFIEGEEEVGERERFGLLLRQNDEVRFLEAGDCREVTRRVEHLRMISEDIGENLSFGGVVDRDWRGHSERTELQSQGLHVLGVHEVENLFLHPPTLDRLLRSLGNNVDSALNLIVEVADRRAGSWIFQAARTKEAFNELPRVNQEVRAALDGLSWENIASNKARMLDVIDLYDGLEEAQSASLKQYVDRYFSVYERLRSDPEFWMRCEGKQALHAIPSKIGMTDAKRLESAVASIWSEHPELVPDALNDLRAYVEDLAN